MGRRSKEEMIIAIRNLVTKMHDVYKEANLETRHLHIESKYITLPFNMIKEAFDWITTIFYSEYDAIKQVKKLLPQEVWDRYKKWGIMDDDSFVEVKLLKTRLRNFRKVVVSNSRPNLFKRTKVNGYFRKVRKAKKNAKRNNKK